MVGLLVSLVLFDGGLNLRLPGDTIKATVLRISVVRLLFPRCSVGSPLAGWIELVGGGGVQRHRLGHGLHGGHPLIQQIRLAPPLGDVLEAEGLVLEPVGAVLALLLLELVLGQPSWLA